MAEFSELGRVEAIRALYEGTGFEPFGGGVFPAIAGNEVKTASRMLLEGIDFDLVYFPLKHLGYKAVVMVTGELYGALAMPHVLQVKLGISAKLGFSQIKELWSGIVTAAKEFGYAEVSLDMQPSKNGLAIAVAAGGDLSTTLRSGRDDKGAPVDMAGVAGRDDKVAPASKDLLCVTGALGAAYLGLRLLEKGKGSFEAGGSNQEELEKYKMLVAAYLRPELPAGMPAALKEAGITPTASLFVDRGLADALLRLQRATGLGAKVYADRIPFEGGSFELGKQLDIDPISAAMNGGDDSRILLAVPIGQFEALRRDFQAFDIIGHLALPEAGACLVSPDGLEHPVSAQGW